MQHEKPIRQHYRAPPIVEAVVELRFEDEVTAQQLFDALDTPLKATYDDKPGRRFNAQIAAELSPTNISTKASQSQVGHILRSSDGLKAVSCGSQTLAIHVMEKYPGWEDFIAQAKSVVGVLPTSIREKRLASLAVRYIDRIVFPETVSPQDLFTVIPKLPDAVPRTVGPFVLALQAPDESQRSTTGLTLANADCDVPGKVAFVYDLNLTQRVGPVFTLHNDAWVDVVDALHERLRDIFEQSITDRLRELFR